MNFKQGKMYILKFFYTGTDSMMAALNGKHDAYSEVWTDKPQKHIYLEFGQPDFDEGFVIITEYKEEDF